MVNVEVFNIFNFKYDGSEGTEFLTISPRTLSPTSYPVHPGEPGMDPGDSTTNYSYHHSFLIVITISSQGPKNEAGGQLIKKYALLRFYCSSFL